jgi:Fic family protein
MVDYESRLEQCEALKRELNGFRPLDAHITNELKRYFRVSLTYTSNALEGNTLTESETKVVLEDGITIGGKPLKDHLEALGHAKAYDYLFDLLEKPQITEQDILELHHLVVYDIQEACPGEYRPRPVIITGTEFIPPAPKEVPSLMAEFINEKLPQWQTSKHPIETAALAHLELVSIHPFMDGNGRTARLLMNLLLLKSRYTQTIIPPVVRADYITTLDIAHIQGNEQPFLNFISQMVHEALKDVLRIVRRLSES